MGFTPKQHTAVYNGKEYTLSAKLFAKLIGRSQSFVHSRLSVAEVRGHKNAMEYAIAESEKCRQESAVKVITKSTRMPNTDNSRAKKQERYLEDKKHLVNAFLYPKNCELQEKRELI